MEELKPCPFCGTEEIQINRIYVDPLLGIDSLPDEVCVCCSGCGIGYVKEIEEPFPYSF